MKRIEKIREMSAEELAIFLCTLMSADDCDRKCPAVEYCYLNHNGMLDWLEGEIIEE